MRASQVHDVFISRGDKTKYLYLLILLLSISSKIRFLNRPPVTHTFSQALDSNEALSPFWVFLILKSNSSVSPYDGSLQARLMLTLRNAFKAASGDENNDAYLVQLTRLEKNAGLDHLRVTFYIQKNGVILAASWVVAIFDRLLPQRLTLLMGAEIIAKPTVYDVGAYDPTNGYLWIFYAIFGSLSVIPIATCFTVSVFILCIKRRKDEFVTNVPVDEGVQTDLPCRRLRFSRNEEEGKDYTCAPMPRLKRYSELSNIANFQLKGGELSKPSAKELSTIDEGSGSTNLTMLSEASTKHEKDTIEEGSVLRREIKTVKRSLPLLFPEEEVASSPDPQKGDAANGELLEPTPPSNRTSETIRHISIAHPSRQGAVEVARKVAAFTIPTVSNV